jgi:Holliday junction resolvase RusA-like endonuclease
VNIEFTFFLPITPKPAPRPRFVCRGKFAQAYQDRGYMEWKDEAAEKLREIAKYEDFRDVAGDPVRVDIDVFVRKPRTSKLAYPKPDKDNYEKGILDALTQSGRYFRDDSQVVAGSTTKVWAEPDKPEGYLIHMEFNP